ncbi:MULTISPECIES: hypothetical protein [unclassified Paenibacillus]|uniref:hypothetical protein n=1 Tax=unclassified Paenibacillus TaxID=185978 RepID=UPI00115FA1BC|nr:MULTISPECIES: hypothetical protein [unclassified Paenibacillus]
MNQELHTGKLGLFVERNTKWEIDFGVLPYPLFVGYDIRVLVLFILAMNFKYEINQALFSRSNEGVDYLYNLLFVTTNDIEVGNLKMTINGNHLQLHDVIGGDAQGLIRLNTDGLTVLTAIIIAVFGFLYMYLSSMLILILHAARLVIYPRMKEMKVLSPLFYFYVDLSFLRSQREQTNGKKDSVADSDSAGNRHLNEYIESYRHLREHGNAFAIISCEIIFALWLILWSFSVLAIVIWVSAGSIAWFIGSYLEIRMVKERRRFER